MTCSNQFCSDLPHLHISEQKSKQPQNTPETLAKQGVEICILKLCRIKPIDENAVDFAADFDNVWFFEEGIKNGGIARNFSDLLCCTQFCGDYHIKAINDKFVKQMSVSEALHELKLDDDGMVNTITKNLKEKN